MEPCDIYIVRHAIAAERGDEWPDDTKRPLTETGTTRFTEAVEDDGSHETPPRSFGARYLS